MHNSFCKLVISNLITRSEYYSGKNSVYLKKKDINLPRCHRPF